MILGKLSTTVWLNASAAGISCQGTLLLPQPILGVPEVPEGRCKSEMWLKPHITHRLQMDKLKRHSYRPYCPVCQGLESHSEKGLVVVQDDLASL